MSSPLTADRILDAAIRIADRDGLAAVSMRRLAGVLAVTPMALYWHFANRTALVDAMAARVIGTADLPAPTDDPWDEQLRSALEAVAGVLRRHRWMGAIATSRYLRVPAYLRTLELLIATITLAGIDTRSAVALLDVSIEWLVTVIADDACAVPDGTVADPELLDFFAAQQDYPHVRSAARALCTVEPEREQLVIAMIIDGVRARSGQARSGQAR